jgi:hypothetical protein
MYVYKLVTLCAELTSMITALVHEAPLVQS